MAATWKLEFPYRRSVGPVIGAFLTHLDQVRGNNPRTRNARLGAIHSFYRYASLSEVSDNAAYLQ